MNPSSTSSLAERFKAKVQGAFKTRNCDFCDKLITVAQKNPTNHFRLDFGPAHIILSSGCPRHQPLLQRIKHWLDLEEGATESLELFQSLWSFSITFEKSDKTSPSLDVIDSSNESRFVGTGIELNPFWIDNATLSRWYSTCISSHGEKCGKPKYLDYLPKPGLRILIDVVDNCLITAPDAPSYLALSYVWGKVDMAKTFTETLPQLRELGALQSIALPMTIKHAMHLSRLLGERYLWIDSLCIAQDDNEFLQDHLGRMASIFAHAQAVIVPVDGANANTGICGLKGAPAEVARHLKQEKIPFGDMSLLVRTDMGQNGHTRPMGKPYFHRGWTFQEYLFARRRICFENNSVWFQCCSSVMYEDHSHPETRQDERDFLLDVGYPSLTVYSRLVEDFNQRQLSYPQDCLSAIAGMLPCYSRVFTGGFLCGLPDMFFDAVLLWQPAGDLVRREPAEMSMKNGSIGHIPTWSWAGWQGSIDFAGWATGNDFVAACSGWIASTSQQTFPITKWYASADISGRTGKRKINVDWAVWRERYRDPGQKLPTGWTRSKRRRDAILTIETPPDGFGDFLYQHESCSAQFWYPLPLSDPTYSYQPASMSASEATYLFSSVQAAHLSVSGAAWMHDMLEAPYVSLYTSQKDWAGVLCLHSRDYFETRGLNPEMSPVDVQLIAISRGSIPNDLLYCTSDIPEYAREERPKHGDKYEFYNVMWISWREGVAYREGLGRVDKNRWESLQVSTIDVILG